jgi:hypothetical protein
MPVRSTPQQIRRRIVRASDDVDKVSPLPGRLRRRGDVWETPGEDVKARAKRHRGRPPLLAPAMFVAPQAIPFLTSPSPRR